MLTNVELRDVVVAALEASPLAEEITGVIRKTSRPLNSDKEDIVVNVSATDIAQIQSAVLNVNIYVPDVIRDGQAEEDTARTRVLSALAAELFEVYHEPGLRIVMESQSILEVEGKSEHFINNKIRLYYCNENG